MKKILTILLVLALTVGAVFAADTSQVVVTAQVMAGQGVGTGGTPSIGTDEYGFYITYGNENNYNVDNLINTQTEKATDLDASADKDYSFSVWYYGKEANSTKHEVSVVSSNWFLNGTTTTLDRNLNAITTSAEAAMLSNSSVSAVADGSKITTTFGTTQASPITKAAPTKVGTFKLDWAAKDSIDVGTYKATVTFTLAGV